MGEETGSSGKSADGVEHVGAGAVLAEVGCTTCGHRLFHVSSLVMRWMEDDRRGGGHIRELLRELDARHTAEWMSSTRQSNRGCFVSARKASARNK